MQLLFVLQEKLKQNTNGVSSDVFRRASSVQFGATSVGLFHSDTHMDYVIGKNTKQINI